MLSKRCFTDSLMICKSNVDIKGMASSAAAMCGFVERDFLRNYEGYIPFRSIAPIQWGNLLITGRAYSITHDGLSLARMQVDMATLGAVAAAIVEFRVKTPNLLSTASIPVGARDLSYSENDITALQEMMISKGIVERSDLIRRERPDDFPDEDEIEILCERLAMGPLELGDQARIMQRPDIAVEFLLNTIKRSESAGSRLTAARMLCLLRNSAGVPVLLEAIDDELRGVTLPGLRTPSFHPLPDHGWAPEVVYYINAVSRTRDSRLVPVLSSVAERVNLHRRVSDQGFAYVHSVAYSSEQMADAAVIPVLEKLLQNPVIQGNAVRLGEDPRNTTDPIRERYAYLEFCLYRSLARCGSVKGYRGLVSYLNEQRLFLSRGAFNELLELTGQDAGFDVNQWNVIIDENVSKLIPRPVKDNIDWS